MIVWTEYVKYRIRLRGFDIGQVEAILRFGKERYFDNSTGRVVAIGRQGKSLLMIPYEVVDDEIVPITVHSTTRQQINFRRKSGRFRHE